jgi:hypothetical protein
MIRVKYWVCNSWPYSLDGKFPKNSEIREIEIDEKETFIKNKKKYYKLIIGHGMSEDLYCGDA